MGAEGSREETELKGLPNLKVPNYGNFKMCAMLGQGNFGGVYKVQNVKTKVYYALKCVPVDAQPGVNRNQQKMVYNTAITEEKILLNLVHPNVVKLHGTFVYPKNPADPKKKSKGKDDWFCLLLEYVRGDTLENVLRKIEDASIKKEFDQRQGNPTMSPRKNPSKKGKSKSSSSSSSSLKNPINHIPRDLCLIWFLKLLETVAHVHSEGVIHSDLHLENVLLQYNTLSDPRNNIELKLSDFGVAKDISGATSKLPYDISGHLFYASPETIDPNKTYDTRADIWSLGVIFLNLMQPLSMFSYIKRVEKFFYNIKTNPEIREKFMKRFRIPSILRVNACKSITFITFFHETNQMKTFIEEIVSDCACKEILSKMLCPSQEERYTAKQLMETKIIRTWKHLLDRSDSAFTSSEFDPNFLDMNAVITVMKLEDEFLFKKCMLILQEFILTDPVTFVRSGGIEVMMKRMEGMRNVSEDHVFEHRLTINPVIDSTLLMYEVWLSDFISISTSMLCYLRLHDEWSLFNSTLRKLTRYVREFGCLSTLVSLIKFQRNDSLYYFTYLLCSVSKTVRKSLLSIEFVRSLVRSLTRRNQVYIIALLHVLIRDMNENEIDLTFEMYKKHVPDLKKTNDLRFFKSLKLGGCNRLTHKKILISLFQEILTQTGSGSTSPRSSPKKKESSIESEIREIETENVESRMISLLCSVIYLTQNFDENYQINEQLNFVPCFIPSPDIQLDYGTGCRSTSVQFKVHLDPTENELGCNTKDKSIMEIVSNLPFARFTADSGLQLNPRKREQSDDVNGIDVLCYYELECLEGGVTDDCLIGYRTTKSTLVMLEIVSGQVTVIQVGKKKKDLKRIQLYQNEDDMKSIRCETGDSFGCGITNHGKVFWTQNNTILGEFEQIEEDQDGKTKEDEEEIEGEEEEEKVEELKKQKQEKKKKKKYQMIQFFPDYYNSFKKPLELKISIQMNGNLGFRSQVNFGSKSKYREAQPFRYQFARPVREGNVEEDEGMAQEGRPGRIEKENNKKKGEFLLQLDRKSVKCIDEEAGAGGMILNLAKERYSENEFIQQLITKIERFGGRKEVLDNEESFLAHPITKDEKEIDKLLFGIFTEPSFEESIVSRRYEKSSDYKRNFDTSSSPPHTDENENQKIQKSEEEEEEEEEKKEEKVEKKEIEEEEKKQVDEEKEGKEEKNEEKKEEEDGKEEKKVVEEETEGEGEDEQEDEQKVQEPVPKEEEEEEDQDEGEKVEQQIKEEDEVLLIDVPTTLSTEKNEVSKSIEEQIKTLKELHKTEKSTDHNIESKKTKKKPKKKPPGPPPGVPPSVTNKTKEEKQQQLEEEEEEEEKKDEVKKELNNEGEEQKEEEDNEKELKQEQVKEDQEEKVEGQSARIVDEEIKNVQEDDLETDE